MFTVIENVSASTFKVYYMFRNNVRGGIQVQFDRML